jgi:hypothetical protein
MLRVPFGARKVLAQQRQLRGGYIVAGDQFAAQMARQLEH